MKSCHDMQEFTVFDSENPNALPGIVNMKCHSDMVWRRVGFKTTRHQIDTGRVFITCRSCKEDVLYDTTLVFGETVVSIANLREDDER